jgi:phosphoribosylamine--glycine ligase
MSLNNIMGWWMKVLVIGQGGREHALVKALAGSPSVTGVHIIPGNPGMGADGICHDMDWRNPSSIIQFCKQTEIDFVVIGPEDPLVAGFSDTLREAGILVVGPSQMGAKLEGSKIFAKEFMSEAGCATSKYEIVKSVSETLEKSKLFTPPYVLKADGLCAGKGVSICKDISSLEDAAKDLFEKKIFGQAGEKALLEQYLPGYELSWLVLTNGDSFEALPLAQDHKQLFDNDHGPNTGGMGTIAPMKISEALKIEIENKIVKPTIRHIKSKNITYRGVVFFGIMMTEKGPMCLEYNTRFGDPETQVVLPLLDGDWGLVFKELSQGILLPLSWKPLHTCCVVGASPGYPENPTKGVLIEGDINHQTNSSYFLHAGTKKNSEGKYVTHGGRVMNAVGVGTSRDEAIRLAYAQLEKINWKGMLFRRDIGLRVNL